MNRRNFLQMPSVLAGAEPPKQQPVKRIELITAKRSEIKILTEHCRDQPEGNKYFIGGPYYDLLLPYLGWNYLMRLSEQLCEDVKESTVFGCLTSLLM